MKATPPHDGTTQAELAAGHTRQAIRERLSTAAAPSYLRDFVFGAIDGAVTTFAVVSGVAGAGLSPGIIIVLGIANLIGDGFSMAAGNYLGTRSDNQHRDRLRRMEQRHIADFPAGEREEIRQIFAGMGFVGQDLDRAVEIITARDDRWIDTMLKEEHGLSQQPLSPGRAALATLVAFVVVGVIPLLPFLSEYSFGVPATPFAASLTLTAVSFFLVGAAKSRVVDQHWFWSGFETLGVGGAAAALAYACGALLKGLA